MEVLRQHFVVAVARRFLEDSSFTTARVSVHSGMTDRLTFSAGGLGSSLMGLFDRERNSAEDLPLGANDNDERCLTKKGLSDVFALVYASYSTVDTPELDLDGITTHASAKNAALGITGYLCFDHGVFFQYLEGERQVVHQLMDSIAKDDRHDVINTVELGDYDHRIFPDWNMRCLNRSDLRRVDLEHVLEHSLFHMDPKLYGQDNIVALIKALVANIAARQAHLKAV